MFILITVCVSLGSMIQPKVSSFQVSQTKQGAGSKNYLEFYHIWVCTLRIRILRRVSIDSMIIHSASLT